MATARRISRRIAGTSKSSMTLGLVVGSVLGLVLASIVGAQVAAAYTPQYVYVPGYYGYGYYQYANPGVQAATVSPYSYTRAVPASTYESVYSTVGPYHRDWTTDRESPLAKPWLRPMD